MLSSVPLLLATLSISLTPCSLPGCKPSFNLNEDEMELGLGGLVLVHTSYPHTTFADN